MKVENGIIQFEYLSAASSSSIGEDSPVTAKALSSSFHASNAPGEPKDVVGIEQIEQMGRNAVSSFNKLFA